MAVPFAGCVIVGGPTVPFTCAKTSTPVAVRASVMREIGCAMGRMRTVTVPLSQASDGSQAVTTNVSIPAKVLPVGVYTKLPSAARATVPCAGAVVTAKVRESPSGSVAGTIPSTGRPAEVWTVRSSTMGGSFGGGGVSTSTVTVVLPHTVGAPSEQIW